jgi:hypothetical protein
VGRGRGCFKWFKWFKWFWWAVGLFWFFEARDIGSNPESITKGLILSFSIYSTYHSTLKYYLKYLKKERSQREHGLETF